MCLADVEAVLLAPSLSQAGGSQRSTLEPPHLQLVDGRGGHGLHPKVAGELVGGSRLISFSFHLRVDPESSLVPLPLPPPLSLTSPPVRASVLPRPGSLRSPRPSPTWSASLDPRSSSSPRTTSPRRPRPSRASASRTSRASGSAADPRARASLSLSARRTALPRA